MLQIFQALKTDVEKIASQIEAAINYLEGDKVIQAVTSTTTPVEAVVTPVVEAAATAAVTTAVNEIVTPTEESK